MTDVVWVALISAGAALVTALVTQSLATRAASKQTDRADKREALQWQRTEALRLEELERKAAQAALEWERAEAREQLAQQHERLRELWGHVLTARWQVLDALDRLPVQGRATPKAAPVSAANLPAHAAGQAYSVALTGLAAVRPSARAFYLATSVVQHALFAEDGEALAATTKDWQVAYVALEDCVSALGEMSGRTSCSDATLEARACDSARV